MPNLAPLEQLRLKNFASLHGRPPGYGAPTSTYLIEYLNGHGASITSSELTSIYQGKKPISEHRASEIEKAFGLSSGWLSTEHEFVYSLTPGELLAHSKLASLASDVKHKLYALVEVLAQEGKGAP